MLNLPSPRANLAGVIFLLSPLCGIAQEPGNAQEVAPPPSATVSSESDETSADELAKKLANPVSSLISVPFQNNFDLGYANDGFRYTLNFQPVIPLSLNEDWNLIVRAIVPFIHQEDVLAEDSSQTGLSDTLLSTFLSPAKPTSFGLTWGVGPVFLIPSATDELLGTEKFGLGPTAVVLQQQGKITYGILANHVWSVAGESGRSDVSSTFLQPFFVYGLGSGRNVALNTETTYDWEAEQWTVPINLQFNQVFSLGGQTMQAQIGARYFAESPDGGPDWGIRAGLTFLFPR